MAYKRYYKQSTGQIYKNRSEFERALAQRRSLLTIVGFIFCRCQIYFIASIQSKRNAQNRGINRGFISISHLAPSSGWIEDHVESSNDSEQTPIQRYYIYIYNTTDLSMYFFLVNLTKPIDFSTISNITSHFIIDLHLNNYFILMIYLYLNPQ